MFDAMLKDPQSTQYHSVSTHLDSSGHKITCGQYNSKNSYGGYVGFKQFAYTEGDLYTASAIYHSKGDTEDTDAIDFDHVSSFEDIEAKRLKAEAILLRTEAAFKRC